MSRSEWSSCSTCGFTDPDYVTTCYCADRWCEICTCRPNFGCKSAVACEGCNRPVLREHAAEFDGCVWCGPCLKEAKKQPIASAA